MMKVIAIVGPIAAGKTTLGQILVQEHGFTMYKLTEAIYDEADKLGLDRTDRVVLQNFGDSMRNQHGVAVLAERIIEKIDKEGKEKVVVESIRNHNELIKLKEEFGENLKIISIDTPIEIRYKRAVERQGQYKEQNLTFEEFKINSERDLGEGNKENEQNVKKCMEMANVIILNEGSVEELRSRVSEVI